MRCAAWLLLSVLVLGCDRKEATRGPSTPVAARMFATRGFSWRVVDLPQRRLRLYIERGSQADADSHVLVDSVVRAQTDVLSLLEEPVDAPRGSRVTAAFHEPATLFVLGSRDDMQRFMGRPLAGFVQQGEPTAFFVWTPDYRAPLRHELAHLYTFERWGRPAAGDSAAWLVEGTGAWAGRACLGKSSDALASGLLARGTLPSVDSLALHFRDLPEDVGMPTAGSLTRFIHAREGVTGLRRRWRAGFRDMLPDSAMQAEWLRHLASIPAATLDIVRVMKEGC